MNSVVNEKVSVEISLLRNEHWNQGLYISPCMCSEIFGGGDQIDQHNIATLIEYDNFSWWGQQENH